MMTHTVAPQLDTARIRADFPILQQQVNGYPLAFLDSAASSQKPAPVIEAMNEYYRRYNANVHRGVYQLSEQATEALETARRKVARFIGARSAREVIWTRNTTEAINLVAYSWGLANLKPGDEVLTTEMEHHSNLVPWQILTQRTGATLRHLPVDYMKIHPSVTRNIESDALDRTHLEWICEAAHLLRRKTAAINIESESALALLRAAGVDYVQGSAVNKIGPLMT